MTWPSPNVPFPTDRENVTPQFDNHVNDHNQLAQTINDDITPQINSMHWGTRGYAETNADQAVSTLTDITGMSVTFTANPSRRYRTTVSLAMRSTGTVNFASANILTGLGGFLVTGYWQLDPSASLALYATASTIETGLSGSQTRKLMVGPAGVGSGTVVVTGSGGAIYIIVEDIGPA